MKKIYIKNAFALFLGIVLGMTVIMSCSDSFLEEERTPNSLSPNIFWKTEDDIMKGLTAAYASLQPNADWAIPFERYFVIDNYRSDEIDFRADVSSWMNIAMFTNDSQNSVTGTEWENLYKGINYANQCIDNIPNVSEGGSNLENLKSQAIAEARFLRAYYYYRLYLNYGERVPIFLHEIEGTEEDFSPSQAEKGEIIKLIESELTEIQGDLPESYPNNDSGRITNYAAAALLGKFYMFQKEFKKAEMEFEKLIDNFELLENYGDNFTGLHKNNKESILEVQFSGNSEGGHTESTVITIHLASFPAFDGGYEEAYPSDWLFNLLKQDKTVEGKFSDRLYSTIIFDDPHSRPSYYGEGESFSDYHNEGEIFWNKFVSWDSSLSPEWDISGFNIPLIRYSDILLLYAECLNNRGATSEAVNYINQVRSRVNVPTLPTSMDKEEVLKHLQEVERPSELALEGSRWYDLIRWGGVKETLENHDKPFVGNYIDSKHNLFPIPHSEFLLNPEWEQNPGFSK